MRIALGLLLLCSLPTSVFAQDGPTGLVEGGLSTRRPLSQTTSRPTSTSHLRSALGCSIPLRLPSVRAIAQRADGN
jgi:hypothetical protein